MDTTRIRQALAASQRELTSTDVRLKSLQSRLDNVQRRPMASQPVEALREELDNVERRIYELEPSVLEHQRLVARREHLRGEIASHRDYQADLDSVEEQIRRERERQSELLELIELLEEQLSR